MLTGVNGQTAMTGAHKAHHVATQFETIHNVNVPNNLEHDRIENDVDQLLGYDIQLTRRALLIVHMTKPSEVASIVRTLPNNKRPRKRRYRLQATQISSEERYCAVNLHH